MTHYFRLLFVRDGAEKIVRLPLEKNRGVYVFWNQYWQVITLKRAENLFELNVGISAIHGNGSIMGFIATILMITNQAF